MTFFAGTTFADARRTTPRTSRCSQAGRRSRSRHSTLSRDHAARKIGWPRCRARERSRRTTGAASGSRTTGPTGRRQCCGATAARVAAWSPRGWRPTPGQRAFVSWGSIGPGTGCRRHCPAARSRTGCPMASRSPITSASTASSRSACRRAGPMRSGSRRTIPTACSGCSCLRAHRHAVEGGPRLIPGPPTTASGMPLIARRRSPSR